MKNNRLDIFYSILYNSVFLLDILLFAQTERQVQWQNSR